MNIYPDSMPHYSERMQHEMAERDMFMKERGQVE